MENDILAILQERAPTFSKGQRAIAQYITESYDKAAFLTASRLGRTVGVSESTVVRFAVELGFDGYPAMQKAMQTMVLNRLTSVQRIEAASDRLNGENVLSLVLQSDMEKLRQTESVVSKADFQKAVAAILHAKRIYLIGVRSAAPLVDFLGHYLKYMFSNVHICTSSGLSAMFENIVGVGPEDAVVAVSFPRYSTSTAKAAQYCRSAGAAVIGLTDTRLSPLGQNADYVLTAKSGMVSLVDSLVAPMSVVNALIVALAAKRERELAKTFESLERVWEANHVYEKRDDGKDI